MAYCYEKKTDRKGNIYIEITGYEGSIRHLVIPAMMENIPVRSIGKYAFSGREDLCSLTLPETIDTLGRQAFYNCKNLTTLSLFDSVEDYYDGVIKQCRNLHAITLHQKRNSFSVMKELLADNDRMLRFCVEPIGLHLTFPAYVYDFVEDVEARVLHHKIEGSGYPYRECVTRKGVDLLAYDRLFFHAADDDYRAAIDIALDRLMYPLELETQAREVYEQYLEKNVKIVLERLIEDGRCEEVITLCDLCLISRDAIEPALQLAAREKQSAITAQLMEYQRMHFAAVQQTQAMTLDDW